MEDFSAIIGPNCDPHVISALKGLVEAMRDELNERMEEYKVVMNALQEFLLPDTAPGENRN